MNNTRAFFLVLMFLLGASAFTKAKLVFEYKRQFLYLAQIQNKIDELQNENTKLNLELSLLKSYPYVLQSAASLGMKRIEQINE
ncbi:MAG: cell division protein FtsL [SAR86 cluster bacterium]|nr:cell division protein FtsL [SAR86 cluster bacterium]